MRASVLFLSICVIAKLWLWWRGGALSFLWLLLVVLAFQVVQVLRLEKRASGLDDPS